MPAPATKKFSAFLSYSHADKRFARWLHHALETYPIDSTLVGRETPLGPVPKSLAPVFRDRDDFSAGHSLKKQTLEAIENSNALVVICSPAAARSKHVNEEIRLFKTFGCHERVIPIIKSGEPGDAERDPFPPAVRHLVDAKGNDLPQPVEPVAADSRPDGDGDWLALQKVVASLIGLPLDVIVGRAELRRRRRRRMWVGIFAAMALLTAAAIASAVFAYRNLLVAEENLAEALKAGSGFVSEATRLSERVGFPEAYTIGLLKNSESIFQSLASKGRKTPELRRRQAAVLLAFARSYDRVGEHDEQLKRTQEAVQLLEKLVETSPNTTIYVRDLIVAHREMGHALRASSRQDEGLAAFRKSLSIAKSHVSPQTKLPDWQRQLAVAYTSTGDALQAANDPAAVIEYYKKGHEILGQLAVRSDSGPGARYDLAASHERLGLVHRALGNAEESKQHFENSHRLFLALKNKDDTNVRWNRSLAVSHIRQGELLSIEGQRERALEQYQRALDVRQRLAASDTANVELQRDLANGHERLGDAHLVLQNLPLALANFKKSREIRESVAARNPSNLRWQRELAVAQNGVARALANAGDFGNALHHYRLAIAILEGSTNADHANPQLHLDEALLRETAADIHIQINQPDEARKQYRIALKIYGRLRQSHPNAVEPWHRSLQLLLALADLDPESTCQHLARAKETLARVPRSGDTVDSLDQLSNSVEERLGREPCTR
ncbi:MAG: toll/interleukin-1 receptor domain-containing protein [Alphaproteobacteria bacterium]|nr:toll/interleukin-1 receptor domain-containing protein [Alphaproteobacteria bacterium]